MLELCNFLIKGFYECVQIITMDCVETKCFKCSDVVKFTNQNNVYSEDFRKLTDDINGKGKKGVYIFYLDDKEILYVGKCKGDFNKSDRSLYDRLIQHFQEKHDGGLFNRLLGEFNNKNKVIEMFKNKIHLKILVFESVYFVSRIEHFLISTLNPKYTDESKK